MSIIKRLREILAPESPEEEEAYQQKRKKVASKGQVLVDRIDRIAKDAKEFEEALRR